MTDPCTQRILSTPEADIDPAETQEWRDAFDALVAAQEPRGAA